MKQIKLFFKHLKHAIFHRSLPLDKSVNIPKVRYVDHRENFKTGDILALSRDRSVTFGDKIFSNIVSGLTGYQIYHVATIIKSGKRLFSMEALIPRVSLRLLSSRTTLYHIQIPDSLDRLMSEDAFTTLCYSKLGIRYSIKDVLQAYWSTELDSDNGVICTELVSELLNAYTGLAITEHLIPGEFIRELHSIGFRIYMVVD